MQHTKPSDIEKTSMEIITRELSLTGIHIPEENASVVKRVIHATADFDFAKNLIFTDNAVEYGVKALKAHTPIITDTNMALSGVSKPSLAKLGCEAYCFMADPDVADKRYDTSCLRNGICRQNVSGCGACSRQCAYGTL